MFKVLFASALLVSAATTSATSTLVYDTTPATPGNQAWGGTLGLDFTVNSGHITVTGLGTFDSSKDGITSDIYVGIFDASTGLLVAPAVNFNGTANPGGTAYVTKLIPQIYLAAGNYQLGAWGYDLGADMNFNNAGPGGPVTFSSLGGALTAVGTHYSNSGAPGAFATNPDVGATRYGAGTLIAAVPEPATWGLMIAGFAMAGIGMRRRTAITA